MKKIVVVVIFMLGLTCLAYAGQTVEHHTYYDMYDPASAVYVYNPAGSAATGDQVAVNTYAQKTIQITGVTVNEYIQIRIEGRSMEQVNQSSVRDTVPDNWAILDTVEFGNASADTAINQIIDVTEFVDFLRVGIRRLGANGTSAIDIRGIFTNLDR